MAEQTQAASSGLTYTGKILDSNDAPVTADSVIFTVTVYDPTGKCWLYTEQRNLDLSQSAGTFSFEVGSDDASTLYGAAPIFNNSASGGPKNLADLFSNKKSYTGLGNGNGCSGTYDPTASADPNEGRLLSVYFKIGASGVNQAIPPMRITPVPIAMQSLSINGYGTGELLRVDQSTVTSAGIANNALSVAQYTEFWALMNKASTSYLPVTGDVTVTGANNKVTTLLGQALPAGPATNGQVLVSNGTAWVLQSMSAGSVASVSGTAPIVVGGTATAPIISLPAATTSVNGYLTASDWNTFNSKLSPSLSSGKVWVGNASGLASEVSLSGDATMDNAGVLTLKNTGTAGTYGSASLVPVITTDAQGRVTGVTTAAPLDTTKLPLAGGTMTGAINMGGQNITNAGNISMAANKTLSLSSNAADPGSPSAGQVWYNSTSNVIKYYDGSAVQSVGAAGAGITSLNGLTSGTQTFAIGTSGTSPAFSSATSTHTLNIPLASTAGVTAGLISKADYDNFNTKLSAVNNTATLTSGKVWIGNASNAATEQTLSGDATITSAGVVTVDKTQSAAASKILQLTASSVAVTKGADIGGAGTGVAHLLYPNTAIDTTLTLPSTAGSASQVLQTDGAGNLSWASPAAILPGLASTQVWVGNASGAASAVSLSGDISSITNAGVVSVNKTTTAQANKLLSLDGSGVAASMGNQLNGLTSGSVTLQASAVTTNYSLTFPAAQGTAGQTLSNNGSGVLSWITPLSSSTGFLNGGNSFGANSSLGNNDNFNLDIKTNNTSRMTILNSGNVGIGTTTPVSPLQISKSSAPVSISNGAEYLQIGGSETGANGYRVIGFGYTTSALSYSPAYIGYQESSNAGQSKGDLVFGTRSVTTDSAPAERMRIDSAGNVGIGTSAPGYLLDVNGSGRFDGNPQAITISHAGTTYGYVMTNGAGINGVGFKSDINSGGSAFLLGSSDKGILVTAAGNVGIGTTTPGSLLDVGLAGTTLGTMRLEGNTSGYVQVQPAAAAGSWTMTLPANAGTNGYVLTT
ncbi:MAG: beta strand repeat-containing protein, partial [Pseudobdellovibrionaceae bacterium]